MSGTEANPCGLNGFAFLEFSADDKKRLDQQFKQMGFRHIAQHRNQDISLYQQGKIYFIANGAPQGQAEKHAQTHGAGACAMGFKVQDAQVAYDYALAQGATSFKEQTPTHHNLLGIAGIGGSVIYFCEENQLPFANDWTPVNETFTQDCGLCEIDHLTHNVHRGHMDKWAEFYKNIFNFSEIRYFDIEGQMTGLISRALGSPCGKIKIPLNESKDDHSQIEEFLHEYRGEGIQHIALATENIYHSVTQLRAHGMKFLDVPETYYEMINDRMPWHDEPLSSLQGSRILIDGENTPDSGLLLQIFTENIFGPVFFEIIQRKGNQGFGEGNFRALFEAIERDQIRRGTL